MTRCSPVVAHEQLDQLRGEEAGRLGRSASYRHGDTDEEARHARVDGGPEGCRAPRARPLAPPESAIPRPRAILAPGSRRATGSMPFTRKRLA